MIVIDTPGMIHPPKGRQLTPQQRALAQAAREAENLVLSKIRCQVIAKKYLLFFEILFNNTYFRTTLFFV
jgi:hypothetical protein